MNAEEGEKADESSEQTEVSIEGEEGENTEEISDTEETEPAEENQEDAVTEEENQKEETSEEAEASEEEAEAEESEEANTEEETSEEAETSDEETEEAESEEVNADEETSEETEAEESEEENTDEVTDEEAAEGEEEAEADSEEEEEAEETEAEPLTDEQLAELGYRKVQILNRNGTDVYEVTAAAVEVIGHVSFEEEIWIKDIAAEGWAQIYTTDEEARHYVKLEEIGKQEITEEDLLEMGYRKVQILNKNGANIYEAAAEDAAVAGTIDFENEIWIKDLETEGWARIFTEDEAEQFIKLDEIAEQAITDEELEELGYRKVQVLNANGTDVHEAAAEDAAVIEHIDFESEIWIKDIETEGWAQIYTEEEEPEKFILLAEIEKQPHTDEEMLEMGYVKVYVAIDIGANIYNGLGEHEEAADHLDLNTELWVRIIENEERAQIIDPVELEGTGYINLVDIIAILKPEGMENLPTREIVLHDVFKEFGMNVIFIGTEVPYELELINFMEDDHYEVKWQYSIDGEEFIDIPDANELTFTYIADEENQNYIWKAIVKLVTLTEE